RRPSGIEITEEANCIMCIIVMEIFYWKWSTYSISGEVAHAINLSGLREVCIRRVDKDEVTLDLVEFRFK
uniref:Uncharacterized protein n=1 Tax=Amphimedon queenslandica TaxID=400682 RepID=A0A1X7TI63_AMPQE